MNLSIPHVVQVLHRAIVEKNLDSHCKTAVANIARVALPLQNLIWSAMRDALQARPNDCTDWETRVFEPIIVDFDRRQGLNMSAGDGDYLVLLATVVILGYEVLLVSCLREQPTTSLLLAHLFDKYICEPEINCKLIAHLKAEHDRLTCAGADVKVMQAVQKMVSLMPEAEARNAAWQGDNMSLFQDVRLRDNASTETASRPSGTVREPTRTDTTLPRDVRVEIFLKPGHTLAFDCVNSTHSRHGMQTITTCIGISMQVMPGFHISKVSGAFDTVTIARGNDYAGRHQNGMQWRAEETILPQLGRKASAEVGTHAGRRGAKPVVEGSGFDWIELCRSVEESNVDGGGMKEQDKRVAMRLEDGAKRTVDGQHGIMDTVADAQPLEWPAEGVDGVEFASYRHARDDIHGEEFTVHQNPSHVRLRARLLLTLHGSSFWLLIMV
ncbi:hypothetical protein ACEQ8H_007633 [Pleosporales sp. CAS-2024a]